MWAVPGALSLPGRRACLPSVRQGTGRFPRGLRPSPMRAIRPRIAVHVQHTLADSGGGGTGGSGTPKLPRTGEMPDGDDAESPKKLVQQWLATHPYALAPAIVFFEVVGVTVMVIKGVKGIIPAVQFLMEDDLGIGGKAHRLHSLSRLRVGRGILLGLDFLLLSDLIETLAVCSTRDRLINLCLLIAVRGFVDWATERNVISAEAVLHPEPGSH